MFEWLSRRGKRAQPAVASLGEGSAGEADRLIEQARHFRAVGDLERAVACCRKALALAPGSAPALLQLGNSLGRQDQYPEAIAAYREALAAKPDFVDALVNLGDALHRCGKLDDAIACCEHAIALDPGIPEAHFNLGNARKDQGRLEEAAACYQRALALAPELAAAHVNLGNLIVKQGRPGEALGSFRKALALDPGLMVAYYNLGHAAYKAGDLAAAKAALERYLDVWPNDEAALTILGEVRWFLSELDGARDCFERSLKQNPDSATAHNGLANVLRNQARHREALEQYELAIRCDMNPLGVFQNLLFCMMCTGDFSARQILDKHREFAERFEKPLLALQRPHENDPNPERRLRLGYMSPDLRTNIVGDFIEPVLRHHDRAGFETHCYFTGAIRDGATERIAALSDRWHDVHQLSESEIADRIRSDGIDVLVDLCGHAPGNRILVYARKPAPVQVSYLDYSTTTGLASMDYRITTEYCDPSGVADRYYSEKLYRLGRTCWTYNPSVALPVSPLPLKANRAVTFGSFNSFYRVTGAVLDAWSRVLRSVPHSRLLVVGVAEGSTQAALLDFFARAGIAAERIAMYGVVPFGRYHELVREADVALAPFPYNGTTTMLDCLWNGVPVVAMKGGETFYSRMACSVLEEMELSGLIAGDADEYVRIAADLVSDADRLEALRQSLRARLERSPMRDFAGFTTDLESAYRSMWRSWCAVRTSASLSTS